MRSSATKGLLGVVLAAAVAAGIGFTFRPQAQEISSEEEGKKVSEDEIKLYIEVYSAMQTDHDLNIDEALLQQTPTTTLSEFRDLERRIQKDEGLVERVRKALLEQAKARAAAIVPMAGRPEEGPTQAR